MRFEDVKNLDFRTVTADQLDDTLIQKIYGLSDNVYAKYSDEKKRELKNGITESFELGEKSKWYLLEKDGELIASFRFDQTETEGKLYIASFMVDLKMQNSAIGQAMIENTLNREAQDNVLEGLVTVDNPFRHQYIEKLGFIITGVEKHKKTGNVGFIIERDDRINSLYATRNTDMSLRVIQTEQPIGEQNNTVSNEYHNKLTPDEIRDISANLSDGEYVLARTIPGKEKDRYVFEPRITQEKVEN